MTGYGRGKKREWKIKKNWKQWNDEKKYEDSPGQDMDWLTDRNKKGEQNIVKKPRQIYHINSEAKYGIKLTCTCFWGQKKLAKNKIR